MSILQIAICCFFSADSRDALVRILTCAIDAIFGCRIFTDCLDFDLSTLVSLSSVISRIFLAFHSLDSVWVWFARLLRMSCVAFSRVYFVNRFCGTHREVPLFFFVHEHSWLSILVMLSNFKFHFRIPKIVNSCECLGGFVPRKRTAAGSSQCSGIELRFQQVNNDSRNQKCFFDVDTQPKHGCMIRRTSFSQPRYKIPLPPMLERPPDAINRQNR